MFVSSLRFIKEDLPPRFDHNLATFSVARIEEGKISSLASDLQEIYGVGDKIASLYLRDIVRLFELDSYFESEDDYAYIVPVDAWIKNFSEEFGLTETADYEDVRTAVISEAMENSCNPRLVERGMWYVGFHSYTILLRLLRDQKVDGSAIAAVGDDPARMS